jgi:hypothetical protein
MSVPWKTSLAESTSVSGDDSTSPNDDVHTQTSDSEHTWRRSGKHTRRKAGEGNQQLETISAPSLGQMSGVPTSASTWRKISATA